MFHIDPISRFDLLCFLFLIAFSGCFYLGGWLFYVGIKRLFRGGFSSRGAILLLLGLSLFLLSRVSFLGWYHQLITQS